MSRRAPSVAPERAIPGKTYTIHYSGSREVRAKWLGITQEGTRWARARLMVKGQIRMLPIKMIDRIVRRELGDE